MTSGGIFGTSGGRPGLRAYLLVALAISAVGLVNALSLVDEAARDRHVVPAWIPFALEFTSVATIIALSPLIGWAVRRAPPGGDWRRFVLVHAPATVVFSLAHVLIMSALRHVVWAAAGRRYGFDLAGEWFYEYRKDVLAYALVALVFWLERRLRRREPPVAEVGADVPEQVELVDGTRPVRFEAQAVLAAEARGNYVELVLADGRRPLVRTTLARALEALGPYGFARTHRSWIVRLDRVTAVEPTGAGDHVLKLDAGVEAPLSRRFPEALKAVRGRAAA